MAGAHLAFTLLVLAGLQEIQANLSPHSAGKSLLDPKRRSEIVDETFLEQKDILLEMLETKLKEVREKRKKKSLNGEGNATNINTIFDLHDRLSGKNLENIDVKMNSKGISNIGESVLDLKFRTGKGSLNMDAHGLSNIGNMHVELGVGETGLFIPGFNDLFVDGGHLIDTKNVSTEAQTTTKKVEDSRRSGGHEVIVNDTAHVNETSTTIVSAKATTKAATHNVTHKHHTSVVHHSSATTVKNSTVQVWNTPDTTGSTKIDVLPLVTVNSTATAAAISTVAANSTAAANSKVHSTV